MTVLIDTCVILDALQGREPFREDAEQILLAAGTLFSGFTTAKAMTDLWYILHRYLHDTDKTRNVLLSLSKLLSVLDTASKDCLSALTAADIPDYEDAVMMATALRTHIDYIVTRNTHDYSLSPVPVLSPAGFLSLLSDNPE